MIRPDVKDLEALFELSVDNLTVSDGERILAFNPAFELTLGYTEQWLQEHSFLEIFHPDDLPAVQSEIERLLQGITTVNFEARCSTTAGEVRWFQFSARADLTRGRIHAIARDVTNSRIDRERLQRYADLLERTQVELKEAIDELTKVSRIDQLTGLPNRRTFEARAIEELSRSERSGHPVAVAMLDIDHFKKVNDTHGHPTGDAVLREISRRLDASRRHQDLVARWGGEEFIALFPETTLDEALVPLERLALSVSARPIRVGSLEIPVRLSGGLTGGVPSPETEVKDLVQVADRALRRAKANGRDRIETEPFAEHGV